MAIHIIPGNKLSAKAMQGVIEEFISRNGTDYGAMEASIDTSIRQVKAKLKSGSAVLVFDDETETTNIFLADDPVLKKLNAVPWHLKTPGLSLNQSVRFYGVRSFRPPFL